ncbi:DEAD/DEAH box helicase [Aspergillus thermomutatus]|uniref:DNA2/NAM7 helicase-like C-terminal domain-containing protein n=1 Tax=Aspergillus thermomutatus TaxID=41047 RepID=A0A397HZV5_ASPTH|nr:uncharacterized protein CDV56_109129 [Aspergillus thermomutatus]RHZ68502.1 hypothetical protein CDV56_109129 [Aspergillus thermomutatus]
MSDISDDEGGLFRTHLVQQTKVSGSPSFQAVLVQYNEEELVSVLSHWQGDGPGIKIRVHPGNQLGVESFLEIRLLIRYNVSETTEIELNLRQCVPDSEELQDGQTHVPALLYDHHSGLQSAVAQQSVWRLDLGLSHRSFHASNLFNHRTFGTQTACMSAIRSYFQQEQITLCLLGFEVRTLMGVVWARMGNDLQSPPLNRWYPKHPNLHSIQVGEYIAPEQRPLVERKTKISFNSHSEYVTTLGFGLIYEHEHHVQMVQAIEDVPIELRLITIPRAGNRRYLGFLSLPAEQQLDLRNGDALKINFHSDPEEADPDSDWHATVTDPMPVTPPGMTTLFLTRRWTAGSGWHELDDGLEPQPIPVEDLRDIPSAIRTIQAHEPQMVLVKVLYSDHPFRRQISALREIEPHRRLSRLLHSNDFSTLRPVNMYEGVSDGHPNALVTFNAKQEEAFRALRSLPNGVGLFQGPPGTGKTFWLMHALLPIVTQVLSPERKFEQVMLIGPSNDVVDHLAQTMDAIIQQLCPGQDLLVTRSARQRPRPTDARPPILDPSDDEDNLLDALVLAKLVADFYAAETARPAGVADRRVKHAQLSLGHRMLQLAGVIPEPWSEPQAYEEFHEFFLQYQAGYDFDNDALKTFRSRTRELRNHVLARSNVVVATAFAVGDTPVRENVKPAVIAVDEAARLTEPELWPMLAWFNPRAILLVGDHQQLRPFVFSRRNENPFQSQLAISLFSRLKLNGLMDVMFTEQHRMVTQLCDLVSGVFYNSQLSTAQSLDSSVSQTSTMVSNYNRRVLRKAGSLIFLDVPGAKDHCDSRQRSRINPDLAAVVYALILDLLARTPVAPHLITVLTPYRGQMHLYYDLFGSNDQLKGVRIHTVDSFQGCESPVVIFDTTAMSRLQFLSDPNRLNVALSRARAGLYIVGGWAQLERPNASPGELRKIAYIGDVLRHLRKARARTPIPHIWQPVIRGVVDGQLVTTHTNGSDPMTSTDVTAADQ